MAENHVSRKLPEWMKQSKPVIRVQNPPLLFQGRIILCHTFLDCAAACDEIINFLQESDIAVLGFDAEWPVLPNKGSGKLALMQICINDICYLLHVYNFRSLPSTFISLINNPKVRLVGINIKNDLWKLGRDFNIRVQNVIDNNCVDIGVLARSVLRSSEVWSLKKLVNYLLKKDINKCNSVRISNWNCIHLTQGQKVYAATDAYVSLLCFVELKMKSNSS